MRIHLVIHLLASFVFAVTLATFMPVQVQAQAGPAQPAVDNSSAKSIGKVVTATGSVTIEHASAVVVQAALSDQLPQAKVGDPVYMATRYRPEPMDGSGSTSPMAPRSICRATPRWS